MEAPKSWRECVCPNCNAQVARFYHHDGRLFADYRMSGRAYVAADQDPSTVHKQWFRGIDVAEELDDCTDSLWEAECNCRVNNLSLRATVDQVSAATKLRVPLVVG